ncbi:hypothetical protein EBZ70_02955 [bacterium]|jgi:hypothetical protein|nr:hypothetical protein [bacterium]
MSDASATSEPKGSFTATLLAAVGGFSIFLIILLVAYLPNKAAPAGDGVKTPAERKAALAELRGKEQTAATTYGWVDKDKGIVRLPLERAVELIVQEAKK